MKRILAVLLALAAALGLALALLPRPGADATPLEQLRQRFAVKPQPSVDHSKFAQLRRPFQCPQEVTAACLDCHNGRGAEVMRSSHWNWSRTEYVPGAGIRTLGKRNILNNFCIGVEGNEESCSKCHVGYGFAGKNFDFKNALNIDCLACHDNSNTYLRVSTDQGGEPDPKVDLNEVAEHVGRPTRVDCLTCHGFGGGGNNVKHGDLEQALFDPARAVDVHMGSDGADMQCVDCHTARQHQIAGQLYSVASMDRDRVTCESCHSAMPHDDDVLNRHTLKVACQTCHIPVYAKVNPTKLHWDWSTAGRLKDGQPFEEKDASGTDVYMSIKGSFQWGKALKPEYAWSDGTASHYLLGDPVDPSGVVKMNELHGSYDEPGARIIPVKVHRAVQIYDTGNRTLVQPKTVSSRPGDGGYWKEFDWQLSAREGMKEAGLPYSGKYGWIRTEMTWPINHMVSPRNETVGCTECHTRTDGRLAALTDFYLPGRDADPWIERLGQGLLLLTLVLVLGHGGARFISSRKRKGGL
jgi:octaheme c-type cytochrome (tetrathionate reductase family)